MSADKFGFAGLNTCVRYNVAFAVRDIAFALMKAMLTEEVCNAAPYEVVWIVEQHIAGRHTYTVVWIIWHCAHLSPV